MAEPTDNYWQSRYTQERRRADSNLHAAAERATEIDALRQSLSGMAGTIAALEEQLTLARRLCREALAELRCIDREAPEGSQRPDTALLCALEQEAGIPPVAP